VRKAATSFVAKSLHKIWPPVTIGVMAVLEVAWILFLVYAFVRFALPGQWAHVILWGLGGREVAQAIF
jgi:hypothetical protein